MLADPRSSSVSAQLADWGLAAACGGLGRIGEVDEALRRIDVSVESFEIGLHQAATVVALWIRGLVLAGLLDQAEDTARRYRERCQDAPGPGNRLISLWSRATDAETLWSSPIVGTAGTTIGMAIEEMLRPGTELSRRLDWPGPVAVTGYLSAWRGWAARKTRQAYQHGFIQGLTQDPTATVLAIIDGVGQ